MVETSKTVDDVPAILNTLDRFNPDVLPVLHQYINEKEYNLEANIATLKIYQFNPDLTNKDVIITILLKSIMHLPGPDFHLCQCLMSEELLADELVIKVTYLYQLLDTCHFKQFWAALPENSDLFPVGGLDGFEDAVRKYVKDILMLTYVNIDRTLLMNFVNIQSDRDIDAFITECGWTSNGEVVALGTNLDETLKPRSIIENIEFENMATIMTKTL
eukprot:CFRG6429T1